MFRYKDGLESYYTHICTILPEKDVLDIDIVGTGWLPHFKRWWHDLFLLSFNCDRAKGFYNSSNSLRTERFRQFRKYKHRIHPLSKFRSFWDCLILHVLIMHKVVFHFTSTFVYDKLPMILYYFGAILELIIIADLYINLKTGFINQATRRVILDTKSCVMNFCEHKLFLYVASAFPLHWLMFLRYGSNVACGLCKCNKYICALKIINIINLIRIIVASSYWLRRRYPKSKVCFLRFVRITAIALVTMIQLYDLSDVVCLFIFIKDGKVAANSTLGLKAALKYTPDPPIVQNYHLIGHDLIRMVHSLLHFSFVFTIEIYYLDRMTSFTAFIIASVFNAWCLIECFDLVNALTYSCDQRMMARKKTMNYMEINQISNTLSYKVFQCFKYRQSLSKITETRNVLFTILPSILKKEINLHRYLKIIMRIPFFTEWPIHVLEQLVTMLKRKVYFKNDIVILGRLESEGLMIVHDGVLAVYSEHNKELGHMIDGDYFGELSLVTNKVICVSYVVAVTNSTILLLKKSDFRKYMQEYPQLFYDFKLDLRARSRHTRVTETLIHEIPQDS